MQVVDSDNQQMHYRSIYNDRHQISTELTYRQTLENEGFCPDQRGIAAQSMESWILDPIHRWLFWVAGATSSVRQVSLLDSEWVNGPGYLDGSKQMPVFLVALFIWIAENVATCGNIWFYPNQTDSWEMVSLAQLNSWYLLMSLSFVSVILINSIKVRWQCFGGTKKYPAKKQGIVVNARVAM